MTLALPWELSFSRVHVPRIPSVYLALRANDKVRRFINIHLHYIMGDYLAGTKRESHFSDAPQYDSSARIRCTTEHAQYFR